MSVVVVATIVPLGGHREKVLAALDEVIVNVHAEDGASSMPSTGRRPVHHDREVVARPLRGRACGPSSGSGRWRS